MFLCILFDVESGAIDSIVVLPLMHVLVMINSQGDGKWLSVDEHVLANGLC